MTKKNRMLNREELAKSKHSLKRLKQELTDQQTEHDLLLHDKDKKMPWEYKKKLEAYDKAITELDNTIRHTMNTIINLEKQITEGVPPK